MTRRHRADAGLSLVEATIILMVLAVLTAVIAPSAAGFVRDAQVTAARADVDAIGAALQRLMRDTGETMLLVSGTPTGAGFGPSRAVANRVTMAVSDGTVPTASVARAALTNWHSTNGSPAAAIVTTLAAHLTTNSAGYRDLSGMSTTTNFEPSTGATYNSEFGWRGAYVTTTGPDPWATRYAVNTEFLGRIAGSVAGAPNQVNANNDVFVISAGPNRIVETAFAASATTAAGDDILYVVSGSVPK